MGVNRRLDSFSKQDSQDRLRNFFDRLSKDSQSRTSNLSEISSKWSCPEPPYRVFSSAAEMNDSTCRLRSATPSHARKVAFAASVAEELQRYYSDRMHM